MANYNIVVKSIKRVDQSNFSGTFSLTDNDHVISTDGGRKMDRFSATVHSGIETIMYEGTPRPKISGTVGQTNRNVMVAATVNDEPVHVLWTAGHRSSVAAAFQAVWAEVGGTLEVGQSVEVNKQNPKGSGRGTPVVGNAVNNDKVSELEAMLKAQSEQLAALMALLANKG
jgi:hypothetical protein